MEEKKMSEFQALLRGKGPAGQQHLFPDKQSSSSPNMSVHLDPLKM
eukprot:CAMPEP_0169474732 /NCGR_PEP_ID=MMETSP1042-20121227/26416_1 /TAXON_ID=464988 /ORGANISM="Hemiselmis andersenii, Strain CCMP1180" /LENGTH=45 /DNA_ID= /DNA_START= /DNA_END= /DNA_ORIENTATION=